MSPYPWVHVHQSGDFTWEVRGPAGVFFAYVTLGEDTGRYWASCGNAVGESFATLGEAVGWAVEQS